MKTATLERYATSADGTLGRLTMGDLVLFTLEDEDKNNQVGESRIPAGDYVCRRDWYYKGDHETFLVEGVPGRSRILFHRGNTEEDTAGCILLGLEPGLLRRKDEETGEVYPKMAVLRSAPAFASFMEWTRDIDTFLLRITDEEAWGHI